MDSRNVRTRFAPSPTGFMHIGGLRTALYAFLFAKKHGGKFILRIEDTDRARFVEGATEVIFDTLKTCGLLWDEGPDIGGNFAPYIQSERKEMYTKFALELVEKGAAYHDDGAIRQRVSKIGETSFTDEIYGKITVPNSEIEEQVLIKSDGMPTYNFANVVDDNLMQISHIIRGNEFLSSTPKYILLYEAFGWSPPVFVHVPPIMRDATHKLSKRDGDAYFSDFSDKGYLTKAVINYITLLGWSPKGESSESEFFTLDELVKLFDLDGISKSPAIFDDEKLRAMNGHYIRALSPVEFEEIARPFIGEFDIDYAVLSAALQPRVDILSEITPQVDFLGKVVDYEVELYNNKKMKTSPESALVALEELVIILRRIVDFKKDFIYEILKSEAEKRELKIGYYLYPLQVALTGKQSAPGGGLDICVMFGKDESLRRINAAIERLKKL
ncbi:MAG: glutamate--tRNA ligase [Oscillospiraceae bacterium]|nr:glutamate--tRNA ligase [Oscillospiraceae bacterium]